VQIIDEPSAAALANRFRPEFGGIIGVFDFGGGTFDFSVVDASAGDFRVLATAGDDWLGGDDLDFAVAEAVANQFWRLHGVDLRSARSSGSTWCSPASRPSAGCPAISSPSIFVPEVMRDAARRPGPAHAPAPGSRSSAVGRVDRARARTCVQALAPLGHAALGPVIIYLSGGTSYIPAVQRALEQRFAVPVRVGVPPEYAACLGAGIHAAQLERRASTTLSALG
jgi:molecular chaperone DnaK